MRQSAGCGEESGLRWADLLAVDALLHACCLFPLKYLDRRFGPEDVTTAAPTLSTAASAHLCLPPPPPPSPRRQSIREDEEAGCEGKLRPVGRGLKRAREGEEDTTRSRLPQHRLTPSSLYSIGSPPSTASSATFSASSSSSSGFLSPPRRPLQPAPLPLSSPVPRPLSPPSPPLSPYHGPYRREGRTSTAPKLPAQPLRLRGWSSIHRHVT